MPLPTERLGPNSSDEDIQTALSESIRICMEEGGRSQEQCQTIANETAQRAVRRNFSDTGTRQIRAGLEES